jgi:hypothetical protein
LNYLQYKFRDVDVSQVLFYSWILSVVVLFILGMELDIIGNSIGIPLIIAAMIDVLTLPAIWGVVGLVEKVEAELKDYREYQKYNPELFAKKPKVKQRKGRIQ